MIYNGGKDCWFGRLVTREWLGMSMKEAAVVDKIIRAASVMPHS
jgi:hypothetical protein